MKAPEPFGRKLFLAPESNRFESRAVLNPSVIQEGEILHMYYRAVDPDLISTVGYLRARQNGEDEIIEKRWEKPIVGPDQQFEHMGVEDPRVVGFEGQYHLFCTVYDGRDACLGYAVAADLFNFSPRKRIGPLFTRTEALKIIKGNAGLAAQYDWWSKEDPEGIIWEKDATILPRKIDGKIVFIHRLQPDIQIAYLETLDQLGDQEFWRDELAHMDKHILMGRVADWESSHMGMGPVPIETPEGWLMIYHGVNYTPSKTYRAGAALLDLDDPQRIIGRTPEPLFEPIKPWEKVGDVDNVVFPEGLAVRDGNILDIYYGGADSVIGRISVRMDHLIDYLKTAPQTR